MKKKKRLQAERPNARTGNGLHHSCPQENPAQAIRTLTRGWSMGKPSRKLIYISLDGLHPGYLSLDARGNAGGSPGNWLMPRLRQFLNQRSVWYPRAKCYLPSAADMNHLNALAGTSSAQTGVLSVTSRFQGWDDSGEQTYAPISLDWARDARGKPVAAYLARNGPESRPCRGRTRGFARRVLYWWSNQYGVGDPAQWRGPRD